MHHVYTGGHHTTAGVAALLIGLLTVATVRVAVPTSRAAASPVPAGTSGTALHESVRTFWVKDKHFYRSPWYAGRHRKMINFGCTRAPYYPPSDRCRDDRGFHHGLDIHMACGGRLFAGFTGVVVRQSSAGALGPAYGSKAFRIRNHRKGIDVVIGHPGRVFVRPGGRVRRGDLIARASDDGAPDGCHLHFEVTPHRRVVHQRRATTSLPRPATGPQAAGRSGEAWLPGPVEPAQRWAIRSAPSIRMVSPLR